MKGNLQFSGVQFYVPSGSTLPGNQRRNELTLVQVSNINMQINKHIV